MRRDIGCYRHNVVVAMNALLRDDDVCDSGEIKKGSALVIRYEGPRGSPGMPEMLSPGAALIGAITWNRRLYWFCFVLLLSLAAADLTLFTWLCGLQELALAKM